MKKIIYGKKYDTKTAKETATWDNNFARSNFNYYEETLYLKKTGEYFLYGFGNAESKYAQRCPDGWTSGENIRPLSEKEAKEWAEVHCDGDTYESIFGEVQE